MDAHPPPEVLRFSVASTEYHWSPSTWLSARDDYERLLRLKEVPLRLAVSCLVSFSLSEAPTTDASVNPWRTSEEELGIGLYVLSVGSSSPARSRSTMSDPARDASWNAEADRGGGKPSDSVDPHRSPDEPTSSRLRK